MKTIYVIPIVSVMLASSLFLAIALVPANAQSYDVVVPGNVNMWCSQQQYFPGQAVILMISTTIPLHWARLMIMNPYGPSYMMHVHRLWPGMNQVYVGTSQPPGAMTQFILMDGGQQIASAQCWTG
jgi:hypothetical protein